MNLPNGEREIFLIEMCTLGMIQQPVLILSQDASFPGRRFSAQISGSTVEERYESFSARERDCCERTKKSQHQ